MALKLDLGAGDIKRPGFTSVDLYDDEADVQADLNALPFGENTVEEIACIQVIEHIHFAESQRVLEEMYRVLQPGGFAIIETPDIDEVCRRILEDGLTDPWIYNLVGQYWRPQDKNRYKDWYHHAGSIHRNPWNFQRLCDLGQRVGFTVERLPWGTSHYPYKENMVCKLSKPL
jgi:predicted SAM-dependent methyltransferase